MTVTTYPTFLIVAPELKKYACDVHTYALMTNHVHPLLTPHRPDAISRGMEGLAGYELKY